MALNRLQAALLTTANREAGNTANEDAALLNGTVHQGEVFLEATLRLASPNVIAVSDGVHSSPCADVASRTVLELLERSYRQSSAKLPARRVRDLQIELGEMLIPAWDNELEEDDDERSSRDDPRFGMTATLVGVELDEGSGTIFHIGDSKAWIVSSREARLMTTDHTIINSMIEDGLAPEASRHSSSSRYQGLDRFLVADSMHTPMRCDVVEFKFSTEQTIVLCSDGLDVVEHRSFVRRPDEALSSYVQRLVARACELGSDDNVTCIAASFST